MAQTFPAYYPPSYGAQNQVQPRVRSVSFGDGYELRVGDGLNTVVAKWSLTWNAMPIEHAGYIEQFFTFHGGVKWFWWVPPRATAAIKVVCKQWTRGPVEGSRTHDAISANFTQVFDLSG